MMNKTKSKVFSATFLLLLIISMAFPALSFAAPNIKGSTLLIADTNYNHTVVENVYGYVSYTDTKGVRGYLVDCGYGLSANDFPGTVGGNIALVERKGPDPSVMYYFYEKVEKAVAAGAVGVIIYDNVYEDLIDISLQDYESPIPVVFISRVDGEALLAQMMNGKIMAAIKIVQSQFEKITGTGTGNEGQPDQFTFDFKLDNLNQAESTANFKATINYFAEGRPVTIQVKDPVAQMFMSICDSPGNTFFYFSANAMITDETGTANTNLQFAIGDLEKLNGYDFFYFGSDPPNGIYAAIDKQDINAKYIPIVFPKSAPGVSK